MFWREYVRSYSGGNSQNKGEKNISEVARKIIFSLYLTSLNSK
jgi:hypothetical protein